jgi:hypothetical protein
MRILGPFTHYRERGTTRAEEEEVLIQEQGQLEALK